jgi:hypothetical protein
MFNDKPADQVVGQVTAAALAIRDLLVEAEIDVWVQAVVASTRAKVSTGVLRLGHVTVADADRLPEIVHASKGSLDAETVSRAVTSILHGAA